MITKDVALDRIRGFEAMTVDFNFSERVSKVKNEFFDTLIRVINAINPREEQTVEAVVNLAQITKQYICIAWEKEYEESVIVEWFADMDVILTRILMDARPVLVR